MTKYIVHAIFCICFFINSQGQTIATDSRGKDVFDFYKSKTFSVPVSASTTSIKLNATFKVGPGKQFYIVDQNKYDKSLRKDTFKIKFINGDYLAKDSSKFTLAKSFGLNVSFTLGNLVSNFAKVSTFHPTYTFSTGFGYNIDVFNNWKNIRNLKNGFWSWNINPYISINNLIIYDTITHTQPRMKPLSEGIEGEANVFLPPRLTKNLLIAISGSFTYEFGNNISQLKNFQKNKPTYTDINAISLGDFIGKLGDLHSQNNIRARISIPIFPKAMFVFKDKKTGKWKDSIQFAIVPYYSLYGITNTHQSNLVGLYVNASEGQNLFSSNSTIVPGLGIGVDWIAASNGLSSFSIFVAGSLDLHNLLPHENPKSSLAKNQ